MNSKNNTGSELGILIILVLVAGFIWFLVLPSITPKIEPIPYTIEHEYTLYRTSPCNWDLVDTPIYSLEDGQEIHGTYDEEGYIHGSFVLGFGGISGYSEGHGEISSQQYYYFYEKEEATYNENISGIYRLNKVPADTTFLIETDSEEPKYRRLEINDSRMWVYPDQIIYPSKENATQAEVDAEFCAVYEKKDVVKDGIVYHSDNDYLIVPTGTITKKFEV